MLSSFHLLPKHVMSKCSKICLAQGFPEPTGHLPTPLAPGGTKAKRDKQGVPRQQDGH